MATGKIRISVSKEQFKILWGLYSSQDKDSIDRYFYRYLWKINTEIDAGFKEPEFVVTHAAQAKKTEIAKSLGFEPEQSARRVADKRLEAYVQWCNDPLLLSAEQTELANDYRCEHGLMSTEEEEAYTMKMMGL